MIEQNKNKKKRAGYVFTALWLFIAFVAVYDGFLVVRHRQQLRELNPLARALIRANGGRIGVMLVIKFVGTIAACSALLLLYWKNPGVGMSVTVVVALLQLGLLVFLHFA